MGIVVASDFARHGILDAAKETQCRCTLSEPGGHEGGSRILAAQV